MRESIRQLWLDNAFAICIVAMCAFQTPTGFKAVSFKMHMSYCKFSACCLYRAVLEGSK